MKLRSMASFLKLGGGGNKMVVRGSKMVSDKMVLPSYQLIIARLHFKITKTPRSTALSAEGFFQLLCLRFTTCILIIGQLTNCLRKTQESSRFHVQCFGREL